MEEIVYNENEPLETLKWINERKKLIGFTYKETTKSLYFTVNKYDDFDWVSVFDKDIIIFDGEKFRIERC